MKTTIYKNRIFRPLLVFIITSVLVLSCSSDEPFNTEPGPYDEYSGSTFETTPGSAALSLPLNNKECEIGEVVEDMAYVTLEWGESADTESYDLVITNLVTGEETKRINLRVTTKDVKLLRGYPYSWTVSSKNSGDVITTSDKWKFYVSGDGETNGVPFPATLLSPLSGATITPDNGKVTLEWEGSDPDGDEVSYTLYADTIDGKQEVSEDWKDLSETSVDIDVQPGTIYYWHVETSDGVNTSISTTYTFKTAD